MKLIANCTIKFGMVDYDALKKQGKEAPTSSLDIETITYETGEVFDGDEADFKSLIQSGKVSVQGKATTAAPAPKPSPQPEAAPQGNASTESPLSDKE